MKVQKITFSNRLIVIIMVYHYMPFLILRGFSWGFTTLKMCNPLHNSKKINFVYRVHGTQIDRLELAVSKQKSVLKIDSPGPKICRFGLAT